MPDLFERDTWACGPNEMLDDLETHWALSGVPHRLHTERFRPTIVVSAGGGGTVTFEKSGTVVEADGAIHARAGGAPACDAPADGWASATPACGR